MVKYKKSVAIVILFFKSGCFVCAKGRTNFFTTLVYLHIRIPFTSSTYLYDVFTMSIVLLHMFGELFEPIITAEIL